LAGPRQNGDASSSGHYGSDAASLGLDKRLAPVDFSILRGNPGGRCRNYQWPAHHSVIHRLRQEDVTQGSGTMR
jgi:hypothetical protein